MESLASQGVDWTPFWIWGELPVFVVRPHAPNRDARTVTVRYEYMYRATPTTHSAKTTSKWFADHNITVLDWPANMADLNVIWIYI